MIGPSRASSIFQPIVLVLLAIFILVNGYKILTTEDENDDDTVTITFSCEIVLSNQNNYPDFVIQQCRQLRSK